MFSWASCAAMVSTLALGIVLDRYGPRLCSVLAHAIIALGCQVFAMSNRFETFALAVCLISLGGPGIQVSIVHLANLFPDNQYLVLSCLNGTISISFAVFAMFDWLWEKYPNVGFRSLFGYYALVVLVSLVASAIYWPDEPFEAPEKEYDPLEFLEPTPEEDYFEATTAHRHLLEQPLDSYLRADINPQLVRHNSYRASKKALDRGDEALISLKDQPFWRQFCSGTYFRTVLFFVTVCFLANFYVASFSTEVCGSMRERVQNHQCAEGLSRPWILTVFFSYPFLPRWPTRATFRTNHNAIWHEYLPSSWRQVCWHRSSLAFSWIALVWMRVLL